MVRVFITVQLVFYSCAKILLVIYVEPVQFVCFFDDAITQVRRQPKRIIIFQYIAKAVNVVFGNFIVKHQALGASAMFDEIIVF